MIPCVRGGAHPVVEDTLGRRPRQIEDAMVEEPIAPRKRLPIERRGQRRQPGRVFVDHVDLAHRLLLGQRMLIPQTQRVKETIFTHTSDKLYFQLTSAPSPRVRRAVLKKSCGDQGSEVASPISSCPGLSRPSTP